VLSARRGRRAPRRRQHPPLHARPAGAGWPDPVRRHHPQPEDHGGRRSPLRRHHGGARALATGLRESRLTGCSRSAAHAAATLVRALPLPPLLLFPGVDLDPPRTWRCGRLRPVTVMTLGAFLVACREARGLSVADLARTTRIALGIVRDLESDRLDQ